MENFEVLNELAQKYRADKDETHLIAIRETCWPMMVGISTNILKDFTSSTYAFTDTYAAAEDLASDTWEKLLKRIMSDNPNPFGDEETPKAYIASAIENGTKDFLKMIKSKNKNPSTDETRVFDSLEDLTLDQEPSLARQETNSQDEHFLLSALEAIEPSLTEKEQQVLQLLKEGKTQKDIAETLDISLKTVYNRNKSIQEKVRKLLAQR